MKCVMCFKEFDKTDLDFLGRCEECFKKYMNMKDFEKPNLGTPYSPKINHDWPAGK